MLDACFRVRLWVGGTGWSEGETKRDTVTGAFFVQVTNDITSDTDTYGEKLSRISARERCQPGDNRLSAISQCAISDPLSVSKSYTDRIQRLQLHIRFPMIPIWLIECWGQ